MYTAMKYALFILFVIIQINCSLGQPLLDCSPVRWGLKGEFHTETIELDSRCDKGKIEYHHSDGELLLHFYQEWPFHVCFPESKQYTVVQPQNKSLDSFTVESPVKSGVNSKTTFKQKQYLCAHQTNTNGGPINVYVMPKSHYYICYVEYVAFPTQQLDGTPNQEGW